MQALVCTCDSAGSVFPYLQRGYTIWLLVLHVTKRSHGSAKACTCTGQAASPEKCRHMDAAPSLCCSASGSSFLPSYCAGSGSHSGARLPRKPVQSAPSVRLNSFHNRSCHKRNWQPAGGVWIYQRLVGGCDLSMNTGVRRRLGLHPNLSSLDPFGPIILGPCTHDTIAERKHTWPKCPC